MNDSDKKMERPETDAQPEEKNSCAGKASHADDDFYEVFVSM